MSTPIIYVAHPFEGDTSNLDTVAKTSKVGAR